MSLPGINEGRLSECAAVNVLAGSGKFTHMLDRMGRTLGNNVAERGSVPMWVRIAFG